MIDYEKLRRHVSPELVARIKATFEAAGIVFSKTTEGLTLKKR